MVDPQRDIIDHRKRPKPLGEAAQFNGRQSSSSLYRAVVGLLIYRWINISTNAGAPKRLRRSNPDLLASMDCFASLAMTTLDPFRSVLRTHTFAEPFDRGFNAAVAVRDIERLEADFDDT